MQKKQFQAKFYDFRKLKRKNENGKIEQQRSKKFEIVVKRKQAKREKFKSFFFFVI